MITLDNILKQAVDAGASDVHVQPIERPRMRIDGALEPLELEGAPSHRELEVMLLSQLTEHQREVLAERQELEFSLQDHDGRPWRVTYFVQRTGLAGAFRKLSLKVPTLQELNLPEVCSRFAHFRSGLVLVTGASGTGKSTTLAAIIDLINRTYRKHIITIEDPVEYLFENQKSIIEQRSVGEHVDSYEAGVRDAMDQFPDVLVVGEMRDFKTIHLALTAAESGTLVFSTLHTIDAPRTVDRIIDVFPGDQKALARAMLAESLGGIISQILLPRRSAKGRVPAAEVMFCTAAVSNLIREGKTHEIQMALQTGKKEGMNTMDDSLKMLFDRKLISAMDAYSYAANKGPYEPFLKRARG